MPSLAFSDGGVVGLWGFFDFFLVALTDVPTFFAPPQTSTNILAANSWLARRPGPTVD
jgi:hypothetical protein